LRKTPQPGITSSKMLNLVISCLMTVIRCIQKTYRFDFESAADRPSYTPGFYHHHERKRYISCTHACCDFGNGEPKARRVKEHQYASYSSWIRWITHYPHQQLWDGPNGFVWRYKVPSINGLVWVNHRRSYLSHWYFIWAAV
jgi:hypothetical protein